MAEISFPVLDSPANAKEKRPPVAGNENMIQSLPVNRKSIPISIKHRSPDLPVNHTNTLKVWIRNDSLYVLLYFHKMF